MRLTSLAAVKKVATLTRIDNDGLVLQMIDAVSANAERYLRRATEVRARVEHVEVADRQQVCSLSAYPISSVASVKWGAYGDFTSDEAEGLVQGEDWRLYSGGNTGLIRSMAPLSCGELQVSYTGGMAATPEEFRERFPDLEMAIALEVAYRYTHRSSVGLASTGGSRAGTFFRDPTGLLEETRQVLDPYRRHVG